MWVPGVRLLRWKYFNLKKLCSIQISITNVFSKEYFMEWAYLVVWTAFFFWQKSRFANLKILKLKIKLKHNTNFVFIFPVWIRRWTWFCIIFGSAEQSHLEIVNLSLLLYKIFFFSSPAFLYLLNLRLCLLIFHYSLAIFWNRPKPQNSIKETSLNLFAMKCENYTEIYKWFDCRDLFSECCCRFIEKIEFF